MSVHTRCHAFTCDGAERVLSTLQSAVCSCSCGWLTLPSVCVSQAANGDKGWTVKYFKGLGTSSSEEAKQYFKAIAKHKITFAYEGERSDDALTLAFCKSRADDRKRWLEAADVDMHVDYSSTTLKYSDFVNQELIQFSLADTVRSIPSVMDGFKPSQRKVRCLRVSLVCVAVGAASNRSSRGRVCLDVAVVTVVAVSLRQLCYRNSRRWVMANTAVVWS